MRFRIMGLWLVVAVLLAGSSASGAAAQQGTPAASPGDTAQLFTIDGIEAPILASAAVADASSIEGSLLLEQLGLPAAASLAPRSSTSAEIYYVASGTLSIQDDFGFGTSIPAGTGLTLNAGTTFTLANQGSEPAVVLRLRVDGGAGQGAATPAVASTGAGQTGDDIAPVVLVQMPVSGLTIDTAQLYLARASFSSGSATGEQGHAGPIGLYVESGALNVVSPSGFEGTIGTGQGVSLPAETPLQASAPSGEATVLIVGIGAADAPFGAVPSAPVASTEVATEVAVEATADTTPVAANGETVLFQEGGGTPFGPWVSASGWSALDDIVVSNGQQCSYLVAPVDLGGVRDYAIEAEIQLVDLPRFGSFGLFGRWNGDLRYLSGVYSIRRHPMEDGGAVLLSIADEEYKPGDQGFYLYPDNPLSATNVALDTDWHTYRFVLRGNELRLYIDGAEVSRTTDNRLVQGGDAGLFCSRGAQISVRSFKIVSLDGTTGSGQTPPQAEVADAGAGGPVPVDIATLLPGAGDVPAQLVVTSDQNRTLPEVAANYTSPGDVTSLFTGWGWQGNVARAWQIPSGGIVGQTDINGVYVSIHAFGSPAGAAAALDYSLIDQSTATGAWEVGSPGLGDYSRALYGEESYGHEITLLVQRGNLLIRVSAAQLEGDPTPAATGIVQRIIARAG